MKKNYEIPKITELALDVEPLMAVSGAGGHGDDIHIHSNKSQSIWEESSEEGEESIWH